MQRIAREVGALGHAAKDQLRNNGVRGTLATAWDFGWSAVAFPLVRPDRDPPTFELCGQTFTYARFGYPNRPWRNERSVELALGLRFLDEVAPARVLEVGNVLSHYSAIPHDIVDKYERAPGVTNVDVVDIDVADPYDAVVSISTLEHVGWHEEPRDPDKVLRARERIIQATRPDGRVLVTCPFGQNPHLDGLIAEGAFAFPVVAYLLRISSDNLWRQASLDEVKGARYGSPYRNANALFVGASNWLQAI
jgi:hypothetical protein